MEADVGAALAAGPAIEEEEARPPPRRRPPPPPPPGAPRHLGLAAVVAANTSAPPPADGTNDDTDDNAAAPRGADGGAADGSGDDGGGADAEAAVAPPPPPPQTAAEATEFYTAYRSLSAIQGRMAGLAADHPHLASTLRIGTSARGRPLTALAIGHTPPDAPVRIAVLGLQHAREWVAGLVPLYAAEMLVRGAGDHPDLAAFLARVQLLVIPIVNPDGFVHTVTTDRLWRKNRSGDLHDCPGVDLNRNWGMDWGGPHATSTDDPCSAVFTGAAPFSEPETAAVRDLLTAHDGVVGFLDFHAYGQLVLGAWAHADAAPAHLPDERAYGAAVTAGVNAVHGAGYLYGSGGELIYLASGVSTDWATAANMSALTIELRPGGTGVASSVWQTCLAAGPWSTPDLS
ncbi:hypothetical protein I4F81_002795 [Pyropia yezoensis]|uniref:Uncharacterized protein n=1 Tax=Pyropia yezoensis TaxID=2788 RepID=A0ACC3BQF0_PYRYE|nr:hypothetical protein I4F81_002795 [Neopyropia yezoensis]